MNTYLQPREIERIRRIANLVVRREKVAVDAEVVEPVGENFWSALEQYSIQFTELPATLDEGLRVNRFDGGRGAIVELALRDERGRRSDVHLSFLVEFKGDIPSITITDLRIP
jgi:hypothetical protein